MESIFSWKVEKFEPIKLLSSTFIIGGSVFVYISQFSVTVRAKFYGDSLNYFGVHHLLECHLQ